MSVRMLAETTVNEVTALIKAEIATALADLRTERGDAKVSTEPPQSYYIYEKSKQYKTPAVFVICKNMDFQKSQMGGNFITARADVVVSVVIEDKDAEKLTIKAWRYQAALDAVLDQKHILVLPNKAKLFLIVNACDFSPIYTADTAGTSQGVFRKEMALSLEVQQRESF